MDNVKKPAPATNSGNGQSVIDRANDKSKDNFPNGQQPSPYFDEYENGLIDIYAPGRVRRFLFVSPFLQQMDMLEFPVHRRDDDSPCQPVRRVQLAPPPLTWNVRDRQNKAYETLDCVEFTRVIAPILGVAPVLYRWDIVDGDTTEAEAEEWRRDFWQDLCVPDQLMGAREALYIWEDGHKTPSDLRGGGVIWL